MKLFYREEGNGDPLIILHGLFGASDNWLPVAHLLSPHFRVILPDLRNHGKSPHHPRHDYDAMTEDVEELIRALHLPARPHLAGHSMGGKIAMSLLLKHPDLIAQCAILDIAPLDYPISAEHQRLFRFIRTENPERFPSRDALKEEIARQLPSAEEQQTILKNIAREEGVFRWKINADALYAARHTLLSWTGRGLRHGGEVLFVKGGLSPYIPDEGALKDTFPAARLVSLPQAGHRLHAEQPEKLAELLLSHFSAPIPAGGTK